LSTLVIRQTFGFVEVLDEDLPRMGDPLRGGADVASCYVARRCLCSTVVLLEGIFEGPDGEVNPLSEAGLEEASGESVEVDTLFKRSPRVIVWARFYRYVVQSEY
jgi:hypothetical protein